MAFDVVTGDTAWSVTHADSPFVLNLAEDFDPCIKGRYEQIYECIPHDWKAELSELMNQTAETAFQIGILAGPIFVGCSDREIDRLERGLIHATVSRKWRCKE